MYQVPSVNILNVKPFSIIPLVLYTLYGFMMWYYISAFSSVTSTIQPLKYVTSEYVFAVLCIRVQ